MKVLIATDGSKNAEESARFVSHLPHREQLDIVVMSVTPSLNILGDRETIEWKKRYAEIEKRQAQQACDRIVSLFEGANVKIETLLSDGHAGTCIVKEALERSIDLIVIGAIGHSSLERLTVGSVSDYVATHAKCSVLVVRPKGLGDQQHKELRICVAFDNSEQSRNALASLKTFDWGARAQLDIVSAIVYPLAYSEIQLAYDMESVTVAMQGSLNRVAQEVKDHFPIVNTHVLSASHIGESVVDFSQEHRSEMIVVGDTGHGLLERIFLGSVSSYVLRHAQCSIWISRSSQSA